MKERPVIFSAPMVRALLAGAKTQTRRIVKPWTNSLSGKGPIPSDLVFFSECGGDGVVRRTAESYRSTCHYGVPGDRLWVKECWGFYDPHGVDDYSLKKAGDSAWMMQPGNESLLDYWRPRIAFAATFKAPAYGVGPEPPARWRPSTHMPRWASRITLEITDVRVERLQSISEADVTSEGIKTTPESGIDIHSGRYLNGYEYGTFLSNLSGAHKKAYRLLWESINGAGSWDTNPWVWVIEFERV